MLICDSRFSIIKPVTILWTVSTIRPLCIIIIIDDHNQKHKNTRELYEKTPAPPPILKRDEIIMFENSKGLYTIFPPSVQNRVLIRSPPKSGNLVNKVSACRYWLHLSYENKMGTTISRHGLKKTSMCIECCNVSL